jgi:hypothetical protein
VKFAVNSAGRIVNIQQHLGNIDLDYCPYYFIELIRYLVQLGQIKPAKLNGEYVNVEWALKVEIGVK